MDSMTSLGPIRTLQRMLAGLDMGGGAHGHGCGPTPTMKVVRGIQFNIAECFLHCLISSGLQCHKILLKTILGNSVNFVPIIVLIL